MAQSLYYRKVNVIEYETIHVNTYNRINALLSLFQDTCGSYWRSDDGEGNTVEVEREDLESLAEMLNTMSVQEFNDTCYVDIEKTMKDVGVETKEDLAKMITDIAEGAYQKDSVVYLDIF